MNKQFYYVNALQTAQEQTRVCNDFNEFIKLICTQKPLYEIISSGTKIEVNKFNKLALDFEKERDLKFLLSHGIVIFLLSQ